MSIKLIVFDLDGVLVDTKPYHYESLNLALSKIWGETISEKEHLEIYDGLSTKQKLKLLSDKRGLPEILHNEIWKFKQEITESSIGENIRPNELLTEVFSKLKNLGYKIAVATNSIRKTTEIILKQLKLIDFIDFTLTSDDVDLGKPNPEIYLRCVILSHLSPNEILILEDSIHGKEAAIKSGCNLLPIDSLKEVNFENIEKCINKISMKQTPWVSNNLNVLIPMAGEGSRFSKAGYTFPKPLVEVFDKPMIQKVIENLNIKAHFIFLCQKSHYEKYNLKYLLNLIAPDCSIVLVDSVTEGAACTTLLAKDLINSDKQLIIANSDQFVEWSSSEFIYSMLSKNADGGILSFQSVHPKWSYAKINDIGWVTEVREKQPISNIATVGIYWWNKGSDYVKYAESMINKNIRVNNEFYVCPVFNEAINDGKKILTYNCQKMWGLGTPEDLKYFTENYK